MTRAQIILASAVWLSVPALSQPNEAFELGANWSYMSRPGETISLTIVEESPPGVGLNGVRQTRYKVYGSGFRTFSSSPAVDFTRQDACIYLTKDTFDSPLAEYIETSNMAGIDLCENLSGRPMFHSIEQVIENLERPISSAPRPRPQPVNSLQSFGLEPTTHAAPVYPNLAGNSRQEGWVLLQFTVTEAGRLDDVVVVDSSPPGLFETSALEWTSIALFQPRIEQGEAVETEEVQTVVLYVLER